MNRFWGWVGEEQILDELRAGGSVASYADWKRDMLDLATRRWPTTAACPPPTGAHCTRLCNAAAPKAKVQENKAMTATTPASSALVRPFTVAIADSKD